MEIEALRRDLQLTRVALCRQVCHTCNSSRNSGRKSTHSKEDTNFGGNGCSPPTSPSQIALSDDPTALANASMSSWETVNEKEIDDKVKSCQT